MIKEKLQRKFLRILMKTVPVSVCMWLYEEGPFYKIKLLGTLGLRNRDVVIARGVGAGLKFNCGASKPSGATGTYELPVQKVLKKYLQPGDTFYDIGSNVGFFTVIAASLVNPSGFVYSFEPSSSNAACLRHNVKINNLSNVFVKEQAVSCYSGHSELLLGKYCGGYTLATTNAPSGRGASSKISVSLVSIDDLVEKENLIPPNVVKIDVEGAELDVMEGMSKTISRFQPIVIYEIDDTNWDQFQLKRDAAASFMRSCNYHVSILEDSYANKTWFVQNFLAVPKIN
jgi:FkbM family methyltransferase